MENQLALSIILPCYNVEKYIAECLDSLYNQDIPETEYEVICVNDCSPDSTRDIIVAYQQKHHNLILIDHEINKKQGGARNTGLRAAKGEYIWFVDPDDFVKENCLKKITNHLYKEKIEILQFNVDINVKQCDNDLLKSNISDEISVISGVEYLYRLMDFQWGKEVEVWRKIYNRIFLINNNLFFPDTIGVGEDVVFFYNTFLKCDYYKHIVDYFYIYRVNNETSTMNSNDWSGIKLSEKFISSLETIRVFNNSTRLPEDFKLKCISSYCWAIKKYQRKIIKLSNLERKRFYRNIAPYNLSILKKYTKLLDNFLFVYPKFSNSILVIVSPLLKFIYKLR